MLHTNTHIHVSEAIQSTLLAGKRQVGTHRVEINSRRRAYPKGRAIGPSPESRGGMAAVCWRTLEAREPGVTDVQERRGAEQALDGQLDTSLLLLLEDG